MPKLCSLFLYGRTKEADFFKYMIQTTYGVTKGIEIWESVHKGFVSLFRNYRIMYGQPGNNCDSEVATPSSAREDSTSLSDTMLMRSLHAKKMKLAGGGGSSNNKTELDKYLAEEVEDNVPEFKILNWWKNNALRFPILSRMARDVLAIPISTVASESAFSTSGRILDDFRSSLTPFTLQALICTQDWLRVKQINVEADLAEISKLEEGTKV